MLCFLVKRKIPQTVTPDETTPTPTVINLEENPWQINDFVWEGLNYFYYWQESVPDLADSKRSDVAAYKEFIGQESNPEDFFESLLHANDRFSWIVDDYEELENALQGIEASNGVEFGLLLACEGCTDVAGYVRYIHPNSDASDKNIQRGDFFYGVNGTTLNLLNYRSLLFGDNLTYTLNMAAIANGAIEPNGIDVALTKIENFETNPILIADVLNVPEPVGYLMYNQFVGTKNEELNDAFLEFKNAGITDLIIDLRYNPGGSSATCQYLASMVTGQFTGEVFAKQVWNSKLMQYWNESDPERLIDNFVNKIEGGSAINSLNLSRVFILTTSSSASASELLINGLKPYIDVIHIGETTVGKNQGSITIHDFIDNDGTKNPDHKYAMQPIVVSIANADDFGDYTDGLQPTINLREDVTSMGILGDPTESLLARAIAYINGDMVGRKGIAEKPVFSTAQQIEIPSEVRKQKVLLDYSTEAFSGFSESRN